MSLPGLVSCTSVVAANSATFPDMHLGGQHSQCVCGLLPAKKPGTALLSWCVRLGLPWLRRPGLQGGALVGLASVARLVQAGFPAARGPGHDRGPDVGQYLEEIKRQRPFN